MKIDILDSKGNKKSERETEIFSAKIREDIVQKVAEVEKLKQPYSCFPLAGKQYSATGKIRHGRRRWKTAAGKGISRVPRKIFWRRGTQFYWEGATVSGTRGGRRAHPPKILGMINTKKINKKEAKLALLSAIAMTGSLESLKKRYPALSEKKINVKMPAVIGDEAIKLKTKEFLKLIENIFGEASKCTIQKKKMRAGKGKMRGRKYKKSAGALLVIGKEEKIKIKGIDVLRANEVRVKDLALNGARLTVYTEKAIADLEGRIRGKKGDLGYDKKEKKPEKQKEKDIK